jgi:hypothetical protein
VYRRKSWISNNAPEVLILAVIFALLSYRLGTFPEILDENVDPGIRIQVNRVFDHLPMSDSATWLWGDMDQYSAGNSPIYGGIIEIGLRAFGLTLFGIRSLPALFLFLVSTLLLFDEAVLCAPRSV